MQTRFSLQAGLDSAISVMQTLFSTQADQVQHAGRSGSAVSGIQARFSVQPGSGSDFYRVCPAVGIFDRSVLNAGNRIEHALCHRSDGAVSDLDLLTVVVDQADRCNDSSCPCTEHLFQTSLVAGLEHLIDRDTPLLDRHPLPSCNLKN